MGMNPITFADLVRWPVIQSYGNSYRKVTGMSLKMVPPIESRTRLCFGEFENPFCSLVTQTPAGCEACLECGRRAQRSAGKKLVAQQISCFAGLTDIAVPVVVNGRHAATLISGQVFRRPATERDFQMVMKMLQTAPDADWEKRTRKAYFETAVVTPDRFQAMVHLLNVFAQYLADYASRHAISASADEPKPVASAKQFVLTHAEEPINLAQVVRHVNVNRFYFCRLFKKATNMTLTEYVARVRVEKAKTLLGNPALRISEIVFAAGFGSIPQFNSVFKRIAGMPATEYRETLRSQLPL
jgi:AraC-like DNA-binding protein